MSLKTIIVFACLATIGVNGELICGLGIDEKCSLYNASCLANMEQGFRTWFQSSEARGYLMVPIDPLKIDTLQFDKGNISFKLTNISVTGVADSIFSIQNTTVLSDAIGLQDMYVHNLNLTALDEDGSDVEITINVDITSFGYFRIVPRCNGLYYLYIDSKDYKYSNGNATVTRGLSNFVGKYDADELNVLIAETIGIHATDFVHINLRLLFAIIDFDSLYTTTLEAVATTTESSDETTSTSSSYDNADDDSATTELSYDNTTTESSSYASTTTNVSSDLDDST